MSRYFLIRRGPAYALSSALLFGCSVPFAKTLTGDLDPILLALRHVGSARTGAYFLSAPFFGACLALMIWPESLSPHFLIAAMLMGTGVWLHLTERHQHLH